MALREIMRVPTDKLSMIAASEEGQDVAPDGQDVAPDAQDCAPDGKDGAQDDKDVAPDGRDVDESDQPAVKKLKTDLWPVG